MKIIIIASMYDLTKMPEKFECEMTVNANGNPSEKHLLADAEEFKLNLITPPPGNIEKIKIFVKRYKRIFLQEFAGSISSIVNF